MFDGIYAALITPFGENGINYDSLSKLVNHLIEEEIDGFFVTGTTSEVMMLTHGERMKITAEVAKTVKNRVKLIAQIGVSSLSDSIEQGLYAKDLGYDAVSMVNPVYHRYNVKEVVNYYKKLSSEIGLPWFAYDIPCCTNTDLLSEEYYEIFGLRGCVGIKASVNNVYAENKLKRRFPDLVILHGSDECLLGSLTMGTNGAVGSTYNLIPKYFKEMSAIRESDPQRAKRIQDTCNDLIETMNALGGVSALKYLIRKRTGIDCGTCRTPVVPLKDEDKVILDGAYCVMEERMRELIG